VSLRFCVLLLVIASTFAVPGVPSVRAQTPFTLSVSPDRVVLGTVNGSTSWFDVTVMAGEGFNGTVSFSVFGAPPGVTAVFQDRVVYLAPLAMFTTCLEVTALPDARQGNYSLTVAAASQGPSVFYAVANRVTLVIQEVGQLRASSECGKTQTANPSATGPEYAISLYALIFAAGIVLGSVATYILVRKSRKQQSGP
jgi:hypothetical protein